jgi:hypothetical protein
MSLLPTLFLTALFGAQGGGYESLYSWNPVSSFDAALAQSAGAADVNGDGIADIAIGASGSGNGAAFVYSGFDGSLIHAWAPASSSYMGFGISLDGVGDINGDGFGDLVIGAPLFTNSAGDAGAGKAFVFSGATGLELFSWEGAGANFMLGSSVANAGDFDGDGTHDILVGAPFASPGGLAGAGSAYLYSGASGGLIFQRNGEASGDIFGNAVSTAGDMNGDGRAELLVGAPAAPSGSSAAGIAYVFGFSPYLVANQTFISASAGGTLHLDLTFPTTAAFDEYKVLLSASGTGPTTYGVDIPLTQDSVVMDSFFGNYPVPNYSNMHGTLNASGNASASFTIPAGIPSALVGRTYHFAAIANQPGQLPEYSSIAVAIEVTL